MAWQGGDDKIAELLKQAYPPAAASPGFKADLRLQVNQQAAALAAVSPKPFWQQPFVWIPAAAACTVAAALIIFFVAFQPAPPDITTREATSVQATTATLNGRIDSLGESESVEVSFEWGPTTDYGNETTPEVRTESGDISVALSGLKPNTTYHYRLKIAGRDGIKYGPDMQFTTGPAPPVTTTGDAAGIGTTSATLSGSLDDMGSATSVQVWFEWGPTSSCGNETSPEPMSAPGGYSAGLSGLTPGITYYFRAKADGDGDPVSGAVKTFTTLTTPPSVTTNDATNVATTSATLNGELTSLGTAAGVTVSFEWGVAPGSHGGTTAGQVRSTAGPFSADLSGLAPGTTYYYRATADGDGQPVYGEEKTFTTLTTPPSVTTNDATNVATTSATLNGELTSLGTARTVTVCFEWRAAGWPYTHRTTVVMMASAGAFSADPTDLTPGTTYYFKARADGDGDPVYGPEREFTTLTEPPSVTTNHATSVTAVSATLNGDLTSLGTAGSVIVFFQWGTAPGSYAYTTADQVRISAGDFSADLSGLTPGTTYYYRAAADGDGDPVYGDEESFTTLTTPPSVGTASATQVHCTSATLNGVLESLGTAESAQVSFEWGITTAYGNETASGNLTAVGSFTAALTGLVPNTTYHFRAKAIGDGVSYGADMTFVTGVAPPGQETWYLSTDNIDAQRVMYEGDTSAAAGTIRLSSWSLTSMVWTSDQSSGDTRYPAGSWLVQLTLSDFEKSHRDSIEIGVWDGGIFVPQGICTIYGMGDDVYVVSVSVSVDSFTVPAGGYLAVRLTVTSSPQLLDVRVGGEKSFVQSPSYSEPTAPGVSTDAATSVHDTQAVLNGYLNDLGSAGSVVVSFEWGTTAAYGSETAPEVLTSDGGFSFILAGLAPGTTYHFRAKVVGDGTNYGIDMVFTTLP